MAKISLAQSASQGCPWHGLPPDILKYDRVFSQRRIAAQHYAAHSGRGSLSDQAHWYTSIGLQSSLLDDLRSSRKLVCSGAPPLLSRIIDGRHGVRAEGLPHATLSKVLFECLPMGFCLQRQDPQYLYILSAHQRNVQGMINYLIRCFIAEGSVIVPFISIRLYIEVAGSTPLTII